MMIDNRFKGLGVAMVTPFDSKGMVDFDGLEKITNNLINGGVDFLVVLGTTGETPTISDPERYAIIDNVIKTNNNRVPIVAGFGGNDTQHVLKALDDYPMTGIDAILSVTPYYNRPNQRGLYHHYKAIDSNAKNTPIILYNVPSRTGANLDAETVLNLANDFENIIGIKEASGNLQQCMDILQNRPDNFLFLSGDDNITYPLMALGGDGVISVIGNAYPKAMSEMVHFMLDKNFLAGQEKHFELLKIMQLIFKDGNPAGVKAILKLQGLIEDNLRLPLVKVSDDVFEEIKLEVEKLAADYDIKVLG